MRVNEATFWRLIDDCRPTTLDPDSEELAANLVTRLSGGTVAAVIGFAEQMSRLLYQLDRREYGLDLSSDAFLYTRAAVVAAGWEEYERVLRDPALFGPYAVELVWAEALLYVPDTAYRALTGEEWNRDTRYDYESFSNIDGWRVPRPCPAAPDRSG